MTTNDVGFHISDPSQVASRRGKFIKNFSYSGPTKNVHVEPDAKAGKKMYVDADQKFAEMPLRLCHSDWIQAAVADRDYSAVDLMEIEVAAHSIMYVAFDSRLDRPDWLAKEFEPTEMNLLVADRQMKIFRREVADQKSFTLGSNAEEVPGNDCNMYVVFVNAAPD